MFKPPVGVRVFNKRLKGSFRTFNYEYKAWYPCLLFKKLKERMVTVTVFLETKKTSAHEKVNGFLVYTSMNVRD